MAPKSTLVSPNKKGGRGKISLTLGELNKKILKCVFCGKSNKKTEGGYFKKKFVCRKCENQLSEIVGYLYA